MPEFFVQIDADPVHASGPLPLDFSLPRDDGLLRPCLLAQCFNCLILDLYDLFSQVEDLLVLLLYCHGLFAPSCARALPKAFKFALQLLDLCFLLGAPSSFLVQVGPQFRALSLLLCVLLFSVLYLTLHLCDHLQSGLLLVRHGLWALT